MPCWAFENEWPWIYLHCLQLEMRIKDLCSLAQVNPISHETHGLIFRLILNTIPAFFILDLPSIVPLSVQNWKFLKHSECVVASWLVFWQRVRGPRPAFDSGRAERGRPWRPVCKGGWYVRVLREERDEGGTAVEKEKLRGDGSSWVCWERVLQIKG